MKHREKLNQQLIEKAMKDRDFRKQLLEDPKTVIEAETGLKMPESVNLHVYEESHGIVYIVLPNKSAATDETEITTDELERVAGAGDAAGTKWVQCTYAYCTDGPDC